MSPGDPTATTELLAPAGRCVTSPRTRALHARGEGLAPGHAREVGVAVCRKVSIDYIGRPRLSRAGPRAGWGRTAGRDRREPHQEVARGGASRSRRIGAAARMAAVRRYEGTVYDSRRWDGWSSAPATSSSLRRRSRDDVDADDLRVARPARTAAPAAAGHAIAWIDIVTRARREWSRTCTPRRTLGSSRPTRRSTDYPTIRPSPSSASA